MALDLSQSIIPIPGTHIAELNQSAVALNLNNENYYGLNPVAFKMYQALTNSPDILSALHLLTTEFNVAEEELKLDLIDLIQELIDNGLVQIIQKPLE